MKLSGYRVCKVILDDLARCAALCRGVHEHDRHGEIAHAMAGGTATVVEHGGEMTGYATSLGFFGHAVGRTTEELKVLTGATPAFTRPGLLLPTRNTELLHWCFKSRSADSPTYDAHERRAVSETCRFLSSFNLVLTPKRREKTAQLPVAS